MDNLITLLKEVYNKLPFLIRVNYTIKGNTLRKKVVHTNLW